MRKIYIIVSVPLIGLLLVIAIALSVIFSHKSSKAASTPSNQKLVIDHDGGADDAMAITMCLLYEAHFNGPEVVALTTTYGNVNQSQVIINSARILELADRSDVAIYAGANRTLIKGIQSDYYFGQDGLGDDGYVASQQPQVEDAYAAVGLIELSKKYEGQLIVVAIGPLTNIALAIRMDSEFMGRLSHLYVGGGNVYDAQNAPTPEFNAEMDVESYAIVAQEAKLGKVTFVPFSQMWTSLNITNDWRENVLGKIQTPIMQAQNGFERISFPQSKEWTLLDPAVAAVALNSTIIQETRNTTNGIILCGDQRGINTNDFTSASPNGNLIYSANVENYKQLLVDIYSAELP